MSKNNLYIFNKVLDYYIEMKTNHQIFMLYLLQYRFIIPLQNSLDFIVMRRSAKLG